MNILSYNLLLKNSRQRADSIVSSLCIDFNLSEAQEVYLLESSKNLGVGDFSHSAEAQVTFGSEFYAKEEQILPFLEQGFSLQIWFEDPAHYPAIKKIKASYPKQIKPCFVVSKKFDYRCLNYFIESSDELYLLPLPKVASLDSYLEIEEAFSFTNSLSEKCELSILYIPALFANLSEPIRAFYQSFTFESFNLAIKSHHFYFIFYKSFSLISRSGLKSFLVFIRLFLLFLSRPNKNLASSLGKSLVEPSTALLRQIGLWRWKIYPFIGKSYLALINSYWFLVRIYWFLVRIYWFIYRILGKFKIAIEIFLISLKWKIYNILCELRGQAHKWGLILLWPFRKSYWFISFQIRKRLLRYE